MLKLSPTLLLLTIFKCPVRSFQHASLLGLHTGGFGWCYQEERGVEPVDFLIDEMTSTDRQLGAVSYYRVTNSISGDLIQI